MLSNRNFRWCLLSYLLVFCIYSGMGIILSFFFLPFGYSNFSVSILAMVFVLVGAGFCFVFGSYLDRTSQYLQALKIVSFGTFV